MNIIKNIIVCGFLFASHVVCCMDVNDIVSVGVLLVGKFTSITHNQGDEILLRKYEKKDKNNEPWFDAFFGKCDPSKGPLHSAIENFCATAICDKELVAQEFQNNIRDVIVLKTIEGTETKYRILFLVNCDNCSKDLINDDFFKQDRQTFAVTHLNDLKDFVPAYITNEGWNAKGIRINQFLLKFIQCRIESCKINQEQPFVYGAVDKKEESSYSWFQFLSEDEKSVISKAIANDVKGSLTSKGGMIDSLSSKWVIIPVVVGVIGLGICAFLWFKKK